jgi:hypothetical protein
MKHPGLLSLVLASAVATAFFLVATGVSAKKDAGLKTVAAVTRLAEKPAESSKNIVYRENCSIRPDKNTVEITQKELRKVFSKQVAIACAGSPPFHENFYNDKSWDGEFYESVLIHQKGIWYIKDNEICVKTKRFKDDQIKEICRLVYKEKNKKYYVFQLNHFEYFGYKYKPRHNYLYEITVPVY